MTDKFVDLKIAKPIAEKVTLEGAAALHVAREAFQALKVGPVELGKLTVRGRLCTIERVPEDEFSSISVRRQAALCLVSDGARKQLGARGVLMTRAFQQAAGLKDGELVRIRLEEDTLAPEADEIVLREHNTDDHYSSPILPEDVKGWEWALSQVAKRADYIFSGMLLEVNLNGFLKRPFRVVAVNGRQDGVARFEKTTRIRIAQEGDQGGDAQEAQASHKGILKVTIPGLRAESAKLNYHLADYRRTRASNECPRLRPRNLVIHGGHGTGKTFALNLLAETNWGKVYRVGLTTKSTELADIFKLALAQQPSMILIDQLDVLISKDRANHNNVIYALGAQLDNLFSLADKSKTFPRVLVVATCLDYLTDVPAELQKLGRFDIEIALPIPDAKGRLEILRFLNPFMDPEVKDEVLAKVADRTHAHSGQDLARLIEEATRAMFDRIGDEEEPGPPSTDQPFVMLDDFDTALRSIKPTAMHDVNLKPPTVHWADIGGNDRVKEELRRMIYYTLNYEAVSKFIGEPPKGLLMYGPPGCSKTLSAQAMATESGFNFFAVKGPELLNMYVGESERAIRRLFNRARQASPSIIFFDEIDSIGGQRGGGGSGGASTQGAVNMLTTLLTEMDGFETLTGVIILAATNRPDAVDPALLRDGRFDVRVFVGLPDLAEREAIARIHLRGKAVASDVDYERLALASEGLSGAEIKGTCRAAGSAALGRGEHDNTITMADLVTAFDAASRGVTPSQVEVYRKWGQQFVRTPSFRP